MSMPCSICFVNNQIEDGICSTHGKVYKGISQLWQDCVCKKSDVEEWHKQECR
jgi:hypothetical protein